MSEPPRPAAIREHPRAPWLAVGVVCFGAFMGQLDASIVTLTFRPMEHEFHAPLAAVQWVSLAYLLTLVALLAPIGRLSDAHGRKLVYTYGFGLFTLASAACGLSPNLTALVGFRVVQAAGAAMLQTNSVALVTTSVNRQSMRLALGIQAGAQSLGLALGPTLGGVLTSTVGWRGVYWVNVPVGIVAIIAARYMLPRTKHFTPVKRFDWLGTGLLATCTTALLLGMSAAGGLPVPGWLTALMFAVAVAAGAGFAYRQTRAESPLIPLSLLRDRQLALALGGALAGYLVLFGPLVLVPQVLTARGWSAATVGLVLSALPIGFGVAAMTQEAILPRAVSNAVRGAGGALLAALGLAGFTLVGTSGVWVPALLAIAGIGLGVFIPANNTVIMHRGGVSSSGMLGGLVNLGRGVGTTLGIAVVTLTLNLAPPAAAGGVARPSPVLPAIALAAVALAAAVIAFLARESGEGGDHEPSMEGASGAFS